MKLQVRLLLILLLGCLGLPRLALGQLKVVPFGQVAALQQADPRPMVIFIHTDWCRYCQAMKHTTLKNEKVVKLLNENFYFLDLNAEEKRNIIFNQGLFRYKPTGPDTGINELAEQLGRSNGKVAYPTLCFLNANYEIIYQHPEFVDATRLVKMLESLRPHLH